MTINKFKACLFFLLVINTPCFAGGLKGNIIDDETIALIIFFIILIHIFCVVAYFSRTNWLRVVCGILYLPIFGVPLILTILHESLIFLLAPMLVFYGLTIIKSRK